MKIFKKTYDDKKVKKIVYTVVLAGVVGWFIYRFVMVAIESKMLVFNPIRAAETDGIIVETVVAQQKDDFIKIPIDIRNNRAYVSGEYRGKLRGGQKIEKGEIVSVSSSIDFDTGMHIVRTRGVDDGLHNVLVSASGYFVPSYAVRDGVVFVLESGVAVARDVKIIAQDSENACVVGNIKNGDVLILSKVKAGQKIK